MTTEMVNVKVVTSDTEGQLIGATEEKMTVEEAKSRCIHYINGYCATPNSASLCNLTSNGCRNNNPVVETFLK